MKEWDNGYLVVMAKYKYNNKPEEEYMTIECSQSAHSIFMQFSLPCNVPQQLTYLPNCISLLPEVVSHISSMLIGSL